MGRKQEDDVGNLWGLQDAAKALREVFRLLDDLARRGGRVYSFYKKTQRKKVAAHLAYLHFYDGGSLKHLQRISSGTFDESDLEGVRRQMDLTSHAVEDAIHRLRQYHNLVREEVGFESLVKLEELIDGQYGKRNIREMLQRISRLREQDRAEAPARANAAIDMIMTFNSAIVELHDRILKERGGKKELAAKKITERRGQPSHAKKGHEGRRTLLRGLNRLLRGFENHRSLRRAPPSNHALHF